MPPIFYLPIGIAIGMIIGFFSGYIFAKKVVKIDLEKIQFFVTIFIGIAAVIGWIFAMYLEFSSKGTYQVSPILHIIVGTLSGVPIGKLFQIGKK